MDNQVGVPNTDHRPVPEIDDIVLTIDQFHVCIIKFNRLGTLIAAGGTNGSIAIVDFTTKTTSNVWNAHALGVTNITWTRDGGQLFSSGLDNVLVISDVVNGVILKRMHIGTFILSASLNPRLNSKFLIHDRFGVKIGSLDSSNTVKICEREAFSTLSFDHRGKYILAGTSKGQIKAFTLEGKCISSTALDSLQPIRYIHPTRRFNLVIVVASDMFLRVYELNELIKWKNDEIADTVNTLYDPTCKTLWHSACASGDSEYVAALASTAHEVTIFERSTEAIVATLCQSKKEIPLGLEWHPAKPAVASVCNGNIFIWKQRPRPCWAAYAPDFTELGENLVYREKESEFDVEDEDFPKDDGFGKNLAEEFLDVESVTAPPGLCSSDEEDPNKIGGSVFIVNASPAVIPLKTTLPSQLRLKDGIIIPELKEPNHVEKHEHKKHKKKKRKKSEESYHHQNGTQKNEPLSPSPERDTPTLNYNYNQRPPSQIDSSQTTSRKSSDAFVESPPRAMRHRLKRKRPSKASKSSTSTSPEQRQSYSRSPTSALLTYRDSPVYAPLSSPPNESPPLPIQPLRRHSPSPINISVSSSNVTPTHENINEQPSLSAPPLTLPQMPPLLPPPPIPKQMAEEHPGLTNISSDEEEVAEDPPSKRQRRSSSSSSSSSAVNHAWDSD